MNTERQRLLEAYQRERHWRRWGPYLSERAWGTVREDYSETAPPGSILPHDHARSKAYRWGEDGIAGICDNHQRLCLAFAFWNGRDPILKERLFGLTGNEGNHGEDVKECYYYLDSTPTHSYMKCLYKYPQVEFPYAWLVEEARRRNRLQPEFELIDTGIFDEDRYFDIFVEYAKADVDDMLARVTVVNRGPDPARLHLLPTLWFRNTWSWGRSPMRRRTPSRIGDGAIWPATPASAISGCGWTARRGCCSPRTKPTRNASGAMPPVAASIRMHSTKRWSTVAPRPPLPQMSGTKACGWYDWTLGPGETRTLDLRLSRVPQQRLDFNAVLAERTADADEFYSFQPSASLPRTSAACNARHSPACCGASSSTTTSIEDWLDGDPAHAFAARLAPPRPQQRLAASLRRRCALDARQVGVPLVCRLGRRPST